MKKEVEIVIEKKIPLPRTSGTGRGVKSKIQEAFYKLKVGDSILITYGSINSKNKLNNIACRVYHWHLVNPDKQLTCRSKEDGIRVWRIK